MYIFFFYFFKKVIQNGFLEYADFGFPFYFDWIIILIYGMFNHFNKHNRNT